MLAWRDFELIILLVYALEDDLTSLLKPTIRYLLHARCFELLLKFWTLGKFINNIGSLFVYC